MSHDVNYINPDQMRQLFMFLRMSCHISLEQLAACNIYDAELIGEWEHGRARLGSKTIHCLVNDLLTLVGNTAV